MLTTAVGCGLLHPRPAAAQPAGDSYTNTIRPGLNLIANQLDHGANTLNDILPGVPPGSQLLKWNEANGTFHTDTFDDLDLIWIDGSSGGPSTTTLGAYAAAFLYNPGAAYELVFTGQPRLPVPPPPVQLRDRPHYLSGPVKIPSKYTDMTGLPPEEGALLLRWTVLTQSYQTNRFTGGAWQPAEPVAEIGEGVVIILPPGPPVITVQPQDLNVTPGATATFTVVAFDGPLSYRWLFNGKAIQGETNATLTLSNVHSHNAGGYVAEVRNALGTTLSREAVLTLAFPAGVQVSLNPDGMLSVVGTDGRERIYLRPNPANATQVQVVQVDSSGVPSGIQTFELSAITGLDFDLGPGYDELVIGIGFGPQWKVALDTGAEDGMLIADERGLPVPKRPDGIVDFLQLRSAFAPVLNLAQTQSNLLAQAGALRAQGTSLLLGGLDLAHLANSNLVNVAVALGQHATNALFPSCFAVHDEAVRLINVASNYMAQAQTFWPPATEPFLDSTSFMNSIAALEADADRYLDPEVPLTPADQAALDAIMAQIEQQSAAHETAVDDFRRMLEATYATPTLTLQTGVEQNVLAPAEMLTKVTAPALEAELLGFEQQASFLIGQGENQVQSRADVLNAAGVALQAAAGLLENNVKNLEQSLDAFFANVPSSAHPWIPAAGGITGVNCQPSTLVTLTGAGVVIGTPLADLITLTGPGGFAAGLADNDWIIGSPGWDVLLGNAGDDAIYGGAGTDFIFGGAGNDCLQGEDGIDLVVGGAGDDEIKGGNDSDALFGRAGNDIIEGNDGFDIVLGGDGDDMIFGGKDIDLLLGQNGNDIIEGNDGTVVNILGQSYHLGNLIFGMAGDDTCNGGVGIDLIFGNDGNDTLNGRDNIDVMFGNDGDDVMHGQEGGVLFVISGTPYRFGNVMFGGVGNDIMDAGGDLDVLFGQNDDDTMSGADGTHALVLIVNDLYFGQAGNDTILGSRVGTDWIFCGPGDDYAEGDDGNILAATFLDFIFGEGGNDTLLGGNGLDLILGGNGDDVIQGGDGLLDVLVGGPGMDQIDGNDGSDLILGGADDDIINGGNGIDACFGGPGNDTVNGNDDPDFLSGDDGDDLVDGGPGLDLCFGMDGNDTVNGGAGPDLVVGNDGDDMCNGNDGFDLVFGRDGADIVHGNAGPDFCYGGAGADCVFGDADPDICVGNEGDDFIDGGAALDFCLGRDGNDELHGGTGNDFLFGNDGDDELYGEDAVDFLSGGDGRDKLIGGPGSDILDGGDGDDLLMGNDGNDFLFGRDGNDWIYGGPDRDFAFGGNGNDVIFGEGGNDFLFGDKAIGGTGDDCIDGGDGKDWIFCGSGNDRAWGRDGKDRIFGGCGDDQLDGGPGNDRIWGGAGILSGCGTDDLYGGSGINLLFFGTSQTGGLAGGCPDVPCSQICGHKFKDLNANGAYDGGEPWLLGVTIYLDLNCNGNLDAGEPSMVTMADNPATPKIDESGYCFKGLTPGTYCVREIVPPGSTQSYPPNNVHVVNLGVFAKASGYDFGNKMCTNTQPLNLLIIVARCGTNKVLLSFSAPLDPATASNPANYFIAPNQTVVSATLVNPQTVCLVTSSPFIAGTFYELTICNVKDTCGNLLKNNNNGCVLASFQCAISKLIYITPDGNGGLNIIWDPTQDVLECSTDLFNWFPVPGATSPYNIIPNGGLKFYRVRKI